MNSDNTTIYFAETDFRRKKQIFGIKKADRRKHMYVVGKTGMGKSTLLENIIIQDIQNGHGVGVLDPHGDLAETLLDYIPKERVDDVIYFNPADMQFPIAFNVLESVSEEQRHLVSAGLMGVFKKIWPDVWSARMEYILGNTIIALLEYEGATLLSINKMLSDKDYRKEVVANLKDDAVKAFWTQEFAKYTDRFMQESIPAVQNKIGQFITNPLMRNIIGQKLTSFDIREAMDDRKILIMNLSKGRIGEGNTHLLGGMLITKIYLAAMSRVDIPEAKRADFYLHVDEFQNFATDAFADILSEARKYALNLTIAHQYIGQLETETSTRVRDAVFGNVGTMIAFRVGATDAEFLEKEFMPEFVIQDLVNLPFAFIYLKLMIDGVTSRPFSAATLPPTPKPTESYREKIITLSRQKYGTPIAKVKKDIAAFHFSNDDKIVEKSTNNPAVPKYEAFCTVCKKKIQVPFQPDNKRPIYCEDHINLRQPLTPASTTNSGARRTPEPLVSVPRVEVPSVSSSPPSTPPRTIVSAPLKKFSPPPVFQKPASSPFTEINRPEKSSSSSQVREGSLVLKKTNQNGKTLFLKDLAPKKPFHLKKPIDLSSLRQTLEESLEDDKEEKVNPKNKPPIDVTEVNNPTKKNIIKPGDSIKF